MREIENVIIEMLKENTGEHFLDSGGAYGRHWEKNQDKNFKDVPVIMLTARREMEDIQAGMNMDAAAYVTKPFKTEVLLGLIDGLLK